MPLYSVKMRASLDGTHISGAERIVDAADVSDVCAAMSRRALAHPKGCPDTVNVTVREVDPDAIVRVPFLPWDAAECADEAEARETVLGYIRACTPRAEAAWDLVTSVRNMRGAVLFDAATGERLEPDQARGVRVTNMDAVRIADDAHAVAERTPAKDRVTEARVLAAKVAHHPAVLAEVCISDDPDYTTGYVSTKDIGYVRIPNMKPLGSEIGGRVFIVDAEQLEGLITYLEETPVLVGGDE